MEKVVINRVLRALCGPSHVAGTRLHYSRVARGFAVLYVLIVVGGFIALLSQRAALPPDKLVWATGCACAVGLVGLAFAIELLGVRHKYDDAGITYRSPWTPSRRVPWAGISKVEWRPVLKWLDVVPEGDG